MHEVICSQWVSVVHMFMIMTLLVGCVPIGNIFPNSFNYFECMYVYMELDNGIILLSVNGVHSNSWLYPAYIYVINNKHVYSPVEVCKHLFVRLLI